MTNTITNFKAVEKYLGYSDQGFLQSPLWHNRNIKSGTKPFASEQWRRQNIKTLDDVFNSEGMLSFENLVTNFNKPRSSFFLYLQLRSALKAYGVPWGTQATSNL